MKGTNFLTTHRAVFSSFLSLYPSGLKKMLLNINSVFAIKKLRELLSENTSSGFGLLSVLIFIKVEHSLHYTDGVVIILSRFSFCTLPEADFWWKRNVAARLTASEILIHLFHYVDFTIPELCSSSFFLFLFFLQIVLARMSVRAVVLIELWPGIGYPDSNISWYC